MQRIPRSLENTFVWVKCEAFVTLAALSIPALYLRSTLGRIVLSEKLQQGDAADNPAAALYE